ncbi:MAG: LysE family translocator [Planctomycetota bacterium]|jgi:threonine/homoserine/homoserine lactone efflux protein
MDISFFFKGLVIGFLIAVPVGPIGVLCIHRSLTKGNIHGLVSGFGAATADSIYGAIAAFGLTFVSDFLIEQQFWFRIIGSIFLCCLGLRTLLLKTVKEAGTGKSLGLAGNYGSTFLLTLMNPLTVLAFAAVFASLGITSSHYGSSALLIAGVFTGSGIWWFLLSGIAGIFREKVSHSNLLWLNRISGTIIILFGLFILFNLKI